MALSRNVESRPFTAICLCNRAAAHQALGQIVDAIADCSLAMALDGKYIKVCLILLSKHSYHSFLACTCNSEHTYYLVMHILPADCNFFSYVAAELSY